MIGGFAKVRVASSGPAGSDEQPAASATVAAQRADTWRTPGYRMAPRFDVVRSPPRTTSRGARMTRGSWWRAGARPARQAAGLVADAAAAARCGACLAPHCKPRLTSEGRSRGSCPSSRYGRGCLERFGPRASSQRLRIAGNRSLVATARDVLSYETLMQFAFHRISGALGLKEEEERRHGQTQQTQPAGGRRSVGRGRRAGHGGAGAGADAVDLVGPGLGGRDGCGRRPALGLGRGGRPAGRLADRRGRRAPRSTSCCGPGPRTASRCRPGCRRTCGTSWSAPGSCRRGPTRACWPPRSGSTRSAASTSACCTGWPAG